MVTTHSGFDLHKFSGFEIHATKQSKTLDNKKSHVI